MCFLFFVMNEVTGVQPPHVSAKQQRCSTAPAFVMRRGRGNHEKRRNSVVGKRNL